MRLWVVECKFIGGTWDICKFTGLPFVFTNYYDAQSFKRETARYLIGKKDFADWWKMNQKDKFRVREYTRREK